MSQAPRPGDGRRAIRDRLRYAFDTYMDRGTGSVVLALLVATVVVAIIISIAVVGVGYGAESGYTVWDVVWRAFLTTIDSGAIGNYTGGQASPGFLLAMLIPTLAGLFITSILIGVIVTGIQGRLEELRKGRSRVLERDQTVILGWSQQIFTILSELVIANENQRRACIVILADRDKVEMEDAIRARVRHPGRTTIVCRSGSPVDVTDLEIVSLQTARSIIVLAPETEDPDVDVIKTILAITNAPDRRPEPYHIVAELREATNLEVARMVGREEVQLLLTGDLIARIIAQTCRQSGLSVVYTEFLDFEGDELYFAPVPERLVGRAFGEALFAYDDSSVVGYLPAGGVPLLNPPMDTVLAAGDQVIAISRDDDTVIPAAQQLGGVREELILAPVERPREPERTLILGWNWRGPAIVRELDAYVAPGSFIQVIADMPDVEAPLAPLRASMRNATLDVRRGDTTDRGLLDGLHPETFGHLIILCYSDVLEVQRADAKTLVTLLHLRDIASRLGHVFSITSEMLDLRNRALAEVTRADDFIVSDRLVSLLVSQVSENRHLKDVFDDLFRPEGSEVYLRPAGEYVRTGEEMTFTTVLESARRRGEVAIGYRRRADVDRADRAYGVVLNPRKSVAFRLEDGDRVIVLADEGFHES